MTVHESLTRVDSAEMNEWIGFYLLESGTYKEPGKPDKLAAETRRVMAMFGATRGNGKK